MDGTGSELGADAGDTAVVLDEPLSSQLREVVGVWSRSQHQLVVLAAKFADSSEWTLNGSPTPAHWLADVADVETCTAREWIRIGRKMRSLPAIADAFDASRLSYSKVRTLSRIATPANEAELVGLAENVPAGELGRTLAGWVNQNMKPEELAELHDRQRSVTWRTEANGMVTFTLRLPPLLAGTLIALLSALVVRPKKRDDASAGHPTLAQQHADALEQLLTTEIGGSVDTELIVHVRGDGNTLDDGTPISDSVVERIAPSGFIRTLIHDANGRPINASAKRRHPTTRQKRVVKARDRVCVDCGRTDLHQYDHNPSYERSGRTVVDELELRCAPCHQKRHRDEVDN